ncbi:MAG: hypothetical protein RBT79_07275, partial [Chiayiivirga sp.]|nr:hypothetical protein [Chiayiivirga sp.]
IVELELVPHPAQPRPEITEMDYDMKDGSRQMRVRAAVAGRTKKPPESAACLYRWRSERDSNPRWSF